jgi:L-ascorbate metabolism protein UlaG (beta-lactamase superfamily)
LEDLGAQTMVPMHYGTFWLSQEPLQEPLPRLLTSAGKLGLADRIAVVREGETQIFRGTTHALAEHPEQSTSSVR